MLIGYGDDTYSCELVELGKECVTVDVDGIERIIPNTQAESFKVNGKFTKSSFIRFCTEIVIPETC